MSEKQSDTTKFQYLHGVSDETLVAPESYTHCWLAQVTMRFSWICFSIMPAMSRSTRGFRNTSASSGRRCSQSGARTTRSFSRAVPRLSGVITPALKFTFTTPATSRWKPTPTK